MQIGAFRDFSGSDWCNFYKIGSEFAYLAWELVDAFPDAVATIEETHKTIYVLPVPVTDQTKDDLIKPSAEIAYVEPSYKEMSVLHDLYLLLEGFSMLLNPFLLPLSL